MNFALWTRVAKLSDAHWVTRFPQLWMVPKFITADQDFLEKHQWILYYTAGALSEDLDKNKPEVVFVEIPDIIYTIKFRHPYNWISSFSHFKNFRIAWQHYAYVRMIDNCGRLEPAEEVGFAMMNRLAASSNCRFAVYRRRP